VGIYTTNLEKYTGSQKPPTKIYDKWLDLLAETDVKTVVDIGCGQGHFTRMLSQNGYKSKGIDPSAEMIREARKNFPQETFIIASANEHDPTEELGILAFTVLPHLTARQIGHLFRKMAAGEYTQRLWFDYPKYVKQLKEQAFDLGELKFEFHEQGDLSLEIHGEGLQLTMITPKMIEAVASAVGLNSKMLAEDRLRYFQEVSI